MSAWENLQYFDYELPESRISQVPRMPRDSARLLVAKTSGEELEVHHERVSEIVKHFVAGDVLVLNNTKVRHARLFLQKPTGGNVEVLLLNPELNPELAKGKNLWRALVKPSKRVAEGTELFDPDGNRHSELDSESTNPVLRVLGGDDQTRLVEILDTDAVKQLGQLPLPPYITEKLDDPNRYQTVYADQVGSAAAPTAGLHLTKELLTQLQELGVEILEVELEVGIGTFRPITSDDINDHSMHSERYNIPNTVVEVLNKAKAQGRRITAVGTTVVRTLESFGVTGELAGDTQLYIKRGFEWQLVDRLMTNFHVPKSSLLVMVDAFVGERWKQIYQEALSFESDDPYRMLSLGDAMLLERKH